MNNTLLIIKQTKTLRLTILEGRTRKDERERTNEET